MNGGQGIVRLEHERAQRNGVAEVCGCAAAGTSRRLICRTEVTPALLICTALRSENAFDRRMMCSRPSGVLCDTQLLSLSVECLQRRLFVLQLSGVAAWQQAVAPQRSATTATTQVCMTLHPVARSCTQRWSAEKPIVAMPAA